MKKSNLRIIIAYVLLVSMILASIGQQGCNEEKTTKIPLDNAKSEEGKAVQIAVYEEGTKTNLDPRNPNFADLQQACEQVLFSANDIIPELVSGRKIEDIKNKELAIELLCQEAKEFKILYGQSIIKPDRLLLILTQSAVIVYYSYPDMGWSAGPYAKRGSDSGEEIKRILRLMNIMTE